MSNRLANLWSRFFGQPSDTKASATWISSTVTTGESISGRYNQPPGRIFTNRATQYVMICALYVGRVCGSQRMRLYAPARNGGGKRINPKSARGKKRLDYLKRVGPRGPGTKAAEYAEYAGDVEEITDHPALDLIHRPNPWQSGSEFTELQYVYRNLSGNCYVYTPMDEAVPEMYLLGPQWVTIIPSDTDFIRGYNYSRDVTDQAMFAPDDVMHTKYAGSPLSPYYGVGPLQSCLLEADMMSASAQAEYHRWLQGGRPDFVVEVDPATSPEQRAQIKAEIKRETQGVRKNGRFLILQNSKINALGFKPKDMEFLNGNASCKEIIWNAFGVPESEMKMNDANYASSSTGNVQFLSRTIAPQCCRHAEDITEMLLYERFGEAPGSMWFAYDEIVPEDELKEAEMDRLDAAAGIITLNEARANRGLDPYDDAVGGVPRFNGTTLEKLDAPTPVPVLAPGVGRDEEDDSDEKSAMFVGKVLAGLLPELRKEPEPAQAGNGVENGNGTSENASGKGDSKHAGGDALARTEGDGGSLEVKLGRRGFLLGIGCLLFYGPSICKSVPGPVAAEASGLLARLDKWHREVIGEALAKNPQGGVVSVPTHGLEKILAEELTGLFNVAAAAGAREIGKQMEVAPASALEFLSTYHVRLAKAIEEDLSATLTANIRDGLEAGESYTQIAQRITAETPDIAGWRSERIARTETANALTEGRIFAWDELGIKEKQWVLSGNPCEFCEAAALTYLGPIPIRQPFYKIGDVITGTQGGRFTVTWRDVQGANIHPNDACGIAPIL